MRQPEACVMQAVAAEDDLEAVRTSASRQYWNAAFNRTEAAPSVTPASGYDWSRVFGRQVQQPQTEQRPAEPEAVAAGDVASDAVFILEADVRLIARIDRDAWRQINRINREINRQIRYREDEDLYGMHDRWVLPGSDITQGDCEDYVLAKRQALIEMGVPAEALTIALVETRRGQGHAVLVLATQDGDMVLDNTSPWIVRWDRLNYRWRHRQVPGSAMQWRAL